MGGGEKEDERSVTDTPKTDLNEIAKGKNDRVAEVNCKTI